MARSPKTVKIADLDPELQKLVAEHVDEKVSEDRLRRLLAGNKRLLAAFVAVWEPEDDDGRGVAHALLTTAVQTFQAETATNGQIA